MDIRAPTRRREVTSNVGRTIVAGEERKSRGAKKEKCYRELTALQQNSN
jgi:hypothetical protein